LHIRKPARTSRTCSRLRSSAIDGFTPRIPLPRASR
jgi:hypothetical protein